MKPHEKAKRWREKLNLKVQDLADMTGYSIEAVYQYERGARADGKKLSDWSWQRYRMACAAAEQQIKTGRAFEW